MRSRSRGYPDPSLPAAHLSLGDLQHHLRAVRQPPAAQLPADYLPQRPQRGVVQEHEAWSVLQVLLHLANLPNELTYGYESRRRVLLIEAAAQIA